MGALQHGQPQLRLGGERDRLGHARLSAPVRVCGPFLGKIKRTVQQSMAMATGVAKEDADLAKLLKVPRA